MAITINNGVQNILGTPGAISGVFSDRPAAIDLADGTLYFSTDTLAIYQAISGTWILYTGGGGGGNQNLQQVTDVGNVTTNDIYVNSVYYNDFAAPDQYGRLNINDFAWIFTDIDNVARCVIQEGAIAFKNKVSNYLWRLDSFNLTKDLYFQMPDSLSGRINDIIPISVNGVYADINGDIAISTSGSTGINGLNGTTNIGLGGTLLNATAINADSFSFEFNTVKTFNIIDDTATPTNFEIGNGIIQTFSGIIQVGLKLDFTNNQYFFGGNPGVNGSAFVVDNGNGYIYIKNGLNQLTGLNFDIISQIFEFGDLVGNNKITFSSNGEIRIDVTNLIRTDSNGTLKGLRLDFLNDNYFFGDYGSTAFGLTIDVTNASANLFCSNIFFITGNGSGFQSQSNETKIGDVNGNVNSTIFGVDDNLETLIATNVITQPNTIAPTLDALKIRINGNDYLIPLYQ